MPIEKPASKQLVIASGRAHQPLAQEVADILNTELVPVTAYDFANGETLFGMNEASGVWMLS